RSVRADGSPVAMSQDPAAILEAEQRDPLAAAGIMLRGDGYRVGLGPIGVMQPDSSRPVRDTAPDRRLPALLIDSSPAKPYDGIGQLRPHYWAPIVEQ